MILAILILYVAPMPPIKFPLNPIYSLGGDVVSRISRWPPWRGDPGYQNGTILAILNLYVTLMPPITFQLNGLGGDVVYLSRWQPSWISEKTDFSNSELPCCHNASH